MNSMHTSLTHNSFIDEINLFLVQCFNDIKKLIYRHHRVLGYF